MLSIAQLRTVTWAATEAIWLLFINTSSITKELIPKHPILMSIQWVLSHLISSTLRISVNLAFINNVAQNQTCAFSRDSIGATIKGFVEIEQGNEQKLMEAVATVGPVAAAMDISHFSFERYGGGNAYINSHCFIVHEIYIPTLAASSAVTSDS